MAENQEHIEERLARARSQHLTPELRRHFDAAGLTIVEFDVVHHRYSTPEKHDAALAWLSDKRREKERREAVRFWLIFGVATAGLIATLYRIFCGS